MNLRRIFAFLILAIIMLGAQSSFAGASASAIHPEAPTNQSFLLRIVKTVAPVPDIAKSIAPSVAPRLIASRLIIDPGIHRTTLKQVLKRSVNDPPAYTPAPPRVSRSDDEESLTA